MAKIDEVKTQTEAGKTKLVPMGHRWLNTAALVDTCLGDKLDSN